MQEAPIIELVNFNMADNEVIEKRANVRIIVSIPVILTLINSNEYKKSISNSNDFFPKSLNFSNNESSINFGFIEQINRKLTDVLLNIDSKLEKILNILDPNNNFKNNSEIEADGIIDLSASGLKLKTKNSVEIGQILSICMLLENFSLKQFRVHGEVIHVTSFEEDNEFFFNIGIKFLDISEEEKDMLIRYIFSKQRKILRQNLEL
ncbi:MAG: PilZ domain-containing protein [Desulfobacterales bacterium]|nr:PilZ domain-containing protein [Desulfobacterales bacterium]